MDAWAGAWAGAWGGSWGYTDAVVDLESEAGLRWHAFGIAAWWVGVEHPPSGEPARPGYVAAEGAARAWRRDSVAGNPATLPAFLAELLARGGAGWWSVVTKEPDELVVPAAGGAAGVAGAWRAAAAAAPSAVASGGWNVGGADRRWRVQ